MSRIITSEPQAPHAPVGPTKESIRSAWRSLGWLGAILGFIGFGQVALHLYPMGMGSPEWEFGVSAQMLGALPLPSIGIAAMLAAAVALGSRWGTIALAALSVAGLLAVLGMLGLFWSVAPMALRNAPQAAGALIRQTAARSTLSGLGFTVLYTAFAVIAVNQLRR